MSQEEELYLARIITKYQVNAATKFTVKSAFESAIKKWAGNQLLNFDFSGSTAKGTEVSCTSDVDFFISLNSNTSNSLSEIYNSLFTSLSAYTDLTVRKQNVSIGVGWNGHKIDFTPGRNHSGNTNDHSLYKNKTNTWTQTNIQKHINIVTGSNRTNEIKLTKIWRENHQLVWPSIFLELFVIDSLHGFHQGNLAANFSHVLNEIYSKIETRYLLDPANTNNVISSDLGAAEKSRIKLQAHSSVQSRAWGSVVW